MEFKSCIINTVKSKFDTHIIDLYSFIGFEILVSDGNQKGIDSFMFSFDISLGKNKSIVCMNGSVSDPIFLGEDSRAVNDKLFSFLVIVCRGFHFNCIITKS